MIWLPRGPVHPQFQVEAVAPCHHSSSQKTRLNDFSYGKKSGQIFLPFCHGRTDGQTDVILIARPRLHSMQRGKNNNRTAAKYKTFDSRLITLSISHYYIMHSALYLQPFDTDGSVRFLPFCIHDPICPVRSPLR